MKNKKILLFALLAGLCALFASCVEVKPPVPEKEKPQTEEPDIHRGFLPGAYYHYLKAQESRNSGDIDKATASLEKALAEDPGSLILQKELGQAYIGKGEYEKATQILETALVKHPKDVDLLLILGTAWFAMENLEKAITAYSRILTVDPSQDQIYFILGELHAQNNDPDSAIHIYRDALRMDPDSFRAYYYLGKTYMEKGDPFKAEENFIKSLEKNADLDPARFALIEVYKQAENHEKVLAGYNEIIERDPSNVRAHFDLALFHLKQGRKPQAKAVMESLMEKGHDASAVTRQMGLLYLEAKDYAEAIDAMSTYLAQHPEDPDIPYFLGMAFEKSNQIPQAVEVYKKVPLASNYYHNALVYTAILSEDPEDLALAIKETEKTVQNNTATLEGMVLLASLYEMDKQYQQAADLLEQALKDHGDEPTALFRLGVVYDKWDKKDEAIRVMKKVIALAPEDPGALNYLGYTYADLGINLEEAEKLILKALQKKPEDGYITDSLGWVYFKQEKYEKALPLLIKAVNLVPDEPTIQEHLGDAYLKNGNNEMAQKAYEKALSTAKEEKAINKLNEKLNKLRGTQTP